MGVQIGSPEQIKSEYAWPGIVEGGSLEFAPGLAPPIASHELPSVERECVSIDVGYCRHAYVSSPTLHHLPGNGSSFPHLAMAAASNCSRLSQISAS
jgi:hypothetical protein